MVIVSTAGVALILSTCIECTNLKLLGGPISVGYVITAASDVHKECSAAVVADRSCVTDRSPFSPGAPDLPPDCVDPLSPHQILLVERVFEIAPQPLQNRLCSLEKLYLSPAGAWFKHINGMPYLGLPQRTFDNMPTFLEARNGRASAFWKETVNPFLSAAAGEDLELGTEWALLANIAHEIGHWLEPYSRASNNDCPPSYPIGVCNIDPQSYFYPSWSHYTPPTLAAPWLHPWGISLRPEIILLRANLFARSSPYQFYDDLLRSCARGANVTAGLQGEFASFFALTSPSEDFADGFMYFALWKAGLSSLTIQGNSKNYDLISVLFGSNLDASECGFSKKRSMLELYWQALPR